MAASSANGKLLQAATRLDMASDLLNCSAASHNTDEDETKTSDTSLAQEGSGMSIEETEDGQACPSAEVPITGLPTADLASSMPANTDDVRQVDRREASMVEVGATARVQEDNITADESVLSPHGAHKREETSDNGSDGTIEIISSDDSKPKTLAKKKTTVGRHSTQKMSVLDVGCKKPAHEAEDMHRPGTTQSLKRKRDHSSQQTKVDSDRPVKKEKLQPRETPARSEGTPSFVVRRDNKRRRSSDSDNDTDDEPKAKKKRTVQLSSSESEDQSSDDQSNIIPARDRGKARLVHAASTDEDGMSNGLVVHSAEEDLSDDGSIDNSDKLDKVSNEESVDKSVNESDNESGEESDDVEGGNASDNASGLVVVNSHSVPFDIAMGNSYNNLPVTYYRYVEPMGQRNNYCHLMATLSDIRQTISKTAWKILKRGLNFVEHHLFVNPGRADWRSFKAGIVGHCNLVEPCDDRGALIKQIGLDIVGGEFELAAGFIGGILGLDKEFATRMVNFDGHLDIPSHLVYTTRKNTFAGNGSPQKRQNPYANKATGFNLNKSPSKSKTKFVVQKDSLFFNETVPIYDVTKDASFSFDARSLNRLTTRYPLYKGGRSDLPSGAIAAVGYTASTFKGGASGVEDLVLLNVLFAILLAKGTTEEERVEERSPNKMRHYMKSTEDVDDEDSEEESYKWSFERAKHSSKSKYESNITSGSKVKSSSESQPKDKSKGMDKDKGKDKDTGEGKGKSKGRDKGRK
ncbi:hypothetical protein EDD18DRAFT_1359604 [Armillaria luteobubalina]|uniref:Uncharacterized protein n=1 Tax=Armillaria luteobubalina TaxID=153913 RepID=A0AA39PR86_9AGAR|nr:hypothetical protein EDD18DRAFT_1359604 [Armillaria luteobubalina]